jgi:nucleoside-diphosphate-sugar epimerase
MNVVITGGAGFLGTRLARKLVERNTLTDASGRTSEIASITLLDVAPAAPVNDKRVKSVVGDMGDATRALLERCRKLNAPPKVVFTSSLAVFGGPVPDPVPDDAPLMPQASYGVQKAIGEYLVYDMTRKGMIDGRSLRLPTVTVRPGKPNRAASSFASGIVREPLSGVEAICPVATTTKMWVTSPRTAIDNLIVGHQAPASSFSYTRSINVPGICVAVGDMVVALREVAGEEVAARVRWNYDPVIDRIVSTWPSNFAPKLGPSLGMKPDADFGGIVRAYISDDLPH